MKRFGRWLTRQTRIRPFSSALLVLLIVVVPGYARIENAVEKSNKAVEQVKRLTLVEDQQAKANQLAACQTRNTATKHGRDRFVQLFAALDVIISSSPNQTPAQMERSKAFITALRNGVPLEPEKEDVDCNQDGLLTLDDYAP